MLFDEATRTIWIRQSWLETAQRCGERGRFAIVAPEADADTSDEAYIGTCAHAGIEAHLNGHADPHDVIRLMAQNPVDDNGGQKAPVPVQIKWTKRSGLDEIEKQATQCYDAWVREIFPVMERNSLLGGRTEVSFAVDLYERDDYKVGIKGTVDYMPPIPELWDWKTAGRAFQQREKQKTAIQPTIYAIAACKGGLASDGWDVDYTYPLNFTYGVMVKQVHQAKGQILTVQRHEGHAAWAIDQIETYIDMAIGYGLDKSWPRDEDHFLCNKTWCPWWDACKGSRVSHAANSWSDS